jgi:hypothetical protein
VSCRVSENIRGKMQISWVYFQGPFEIGRDAVRYAVRYAGKGTVTMFQKMGSTGVRLR